MDLDTIGKFVVTVGLPSACTLYFVWWLTQKLNGKLDSLNAKLATNTDEIKANSAKIDANTKAMQENTAAYKQAMRVLKARKGTP
jgi:hypothetical protein